MEQRMSDECCCCKAASPLTIGGWSLDIPEYCNCAYDVIDRYAEETPEKLAMIWVNQEGVEKRFTFADFSRLSNQAANMLLAKGVRQGDKVFLRLLDSNSPFFCLKLVYEGDTLCGAVLNGEEIDVYEKN